MLFVIILNNNTDNLIIENKEDYIKNMRKNGTFGGTIEIHAYYNIKIKKFIAFLEHYKKSINLKRKIVTQLELIYSVKITI